MSKQVAEYIVKHVTFETPLSASEVAKRLDASTGKYAPGTPIMRPFSAVQTRADVEKATENITGGKGFIQFSLIEHHSWLRAYLQSQDIPEIYLFTIGNPLIAQTMLQYDLVAGLYVPPRVLVLGNADGKGSRVIYDLPSSLITGAHAGGSNASELRKAAEALDAKYEDLITNAITL